MTPTLRSSFESNPKYFIILMCIVIIIFLSFWWHFDKEIIEQNNQYEKEIDFISEKIDDEISNNSTASQIITTIESNCGLYSSSTFKCNRVFKEKYRKQN